MTRATAAAIRSGRAAPEASRGLPQPSSFGKATVEIGLRTQMAAQNQIVCLADYILDDPRIVSRACDLLDRIGANADAFLAARTNLPPVLGGVWERLMGAAVDFCESLAARFQGDAREADRAGLAAGAMAFADADIAALKVFARDPACAGVAPEAHDIVRQCRHIQALAFAETPAPRRKRPSRAVHRKMN
jgi:hypothetical protein